MVKRPQELRMAKVVLQMKLHSKLERKDKKMDEKIREKHHIIKKVFKKKSTVGELFAKEENVIKTIHAKHE